MNDPNRKLAAVGVGPQKTGSTWLHARLETHAELHLPPIKETFFWDQNFDNGMDWYFGQFRPKGSQGQVAGGESTLGARLMEIGPTYFSNAETAARLHAHNPELRVVISLRDPVARALSLHAHHQKRGRVGADFGTAVDEIPEIIEGSRYAQHVPRWLDTFGNERVLVILQNDMRDEPEELMGHLYSFLGVTPVPLPTHVSERVYGGSMPRYPWLARKATVVGDWLRRRHIMAPFAWARALGLNRVYRGGGDLASCDPCTRQRLINEFEDDISFVEELLARDLSPWRSVASDEE